jgi:hypothetical protein
MVRYVTLRTYITNKTHQTRKVLWVTIDRSIRRCCVYRSNEGSTFVTTELQFARLGLMTVHLGTKEPDRRVVISKTEVMYIHTYSTYSTSRLGTRQRIADPSSTEDYSTYGVGNNSNFISFCDSFRYGGTQIGRSRPTLRRLPTLKLEFELLLLLATIQIQIQIQIQKLFYWDDCFSPS